MTLYPTELLSKLILNSFALHANMFKIYVADIRQWSGEWNIHYCQSRWKMWSHRPMVSKTCMFCFSTDVNINDLVLVQNHVLLKPIFYPTLQWPLLAGPGQCVWIHCTHYKSTLLEKRVYAVPYIYILYCNQQRTI